MSDPWANLTKDQFTMLNISEKLCTAEGIYQGMFYAATLAGKSDAAQIAWELRCGAAGARLQLSDFFNNRKVT